MKTNYFSHRMKCVLSLILLSFVCFAQSAMAVDWGTTIYYTRTGITQNGVNGRFYCTERTDGGLNIVGIHLDAKPSNGDVIIIPEQLGNKFVYGMNRCGIYNAVNNGGENFYYTPLKWENAPDQFGLSVPGSMKDLFTLSPTATNASDAVPNSALTELIIRDTNQPTSELRINAFAFKGFSNLKKVTLGRGVKFIEKYAFDGVKITEISAFPEGLEYVEQYAFNAILVNRDLILPSTLTKLGDFIFGNARIDAGWFYHNDLQIPTGLKYIGYAALCGSRKVDMKLTIPQGVETIGGLNFANTFIKEVTIPSTIKRIDVGAFRDMMMLEKVTFEENTVLATLGNSLFYNDPNLRYVDMSKVNCPTLSLTQLTRTIPSTPPNPGIYVFAGSKPYTVIYLPKSATGDGVVATGEENFVQYDGSAWKCDKFAVYDSHASYLPANINYSPNFPKHDGGTANVGKPHYAPTMMTDEEKTQFTTWKSSLIAGRGCDYELPIAFTATSAVYKRAFTPVADGLMTLSLPYCTTAEQNGMKLFKLASEKELNGSYNNKGEFFLSLDDSRLNQSSLTDEEKTKCATADHAYLIKVTDVAGLGTAKDGYYTLFASENAKVPATPTTSTVTVADDNKSTWSFAGRSMNISNTDAAAAKFYNLNSSAKTWHPIKNTVAGGFVHSFRGVLKYTGTSESYAQSFPKMVGTDEDFDTATGINAVEISSTADATVYTLDGRKLGTSLEALPAGVYVVGGKKVMK
ncbi:MAG: leucine-rich repeat protein [Alloprevotella sp.]|nr:leucine-rich repeat protein [Alloprevotella sp.]